MMENRTRAEVVLSSILSLIYWMPSERQINLLPPPLDRT